MRIKEIFYDNWGNTPEIVCRFFRILEKRIEIGNS